MDATRAAKLAQLRAKTDRQLDEMVRSRLKEAFALVQEAERDRLSHRWAAASEKERKAEAAVREARMLIRIGKRPPAVVPHIQPEPSLVGAD